MKSARKVTVASLAAVALFTPLLTVGVASASPQVHATSVSMATGAPNQDITTTAQWDKLVAYVAELSGKKATPATANQKQAYAQKLTLVADRATQKAESQWYRATSKEKKMKQRADNQIRREYQQEKKTLVGDVKNAYNAKLNTLENTYNANMVKLSNAYNASQDKLGKKKAKLQKKLAKATDQVEVDKLTAQIAELSNTMKQNQVNYTTDKQDLTNAYNKNKSMLQNDYEMKKAKALREAQRDRRNAFKATKKTYNMDIRDENRAKTVAEQKISNQKTKGTGYIDLMPLAPEPSPSPAL